MSAINNFARLIEATDVAKQIRNRLKEDPARLLGRICQEYENTGMPVPDHHLELHGYLGEASAMALISAGLIKKQPGGRTSLYCFEPTKKGRNQYEKLKADGFYAKHN